MRLYEINEELEKFLTENIDSETGEILNPEKLDELMQMKEDKIEQVALYLKNTQAEAEAIKAEKLALADRQAKTERKVASLKNYLMYATEGQKFSTARVAISYRKSEQVVISDNAQIPEPYTTVKVEPNKTAIKARLKAGEEIIGCELVSVNNIQIK